MVAQWAVGSVGKTQAWTGKTRARGRAGALIHAALAAITVVAVVAVAYGSAAPQLGVAEFAPAARSAVEPPPTTLDAARTGGANGANRRTTTTTAPVARATTSAPDSSSGTTPTTRVGRSRQCYGNPPRQTEDPMSPPCVAAIFEGDNGGATSPGVSATEIRVAVPGLAPSATSATNRTIDTLFEYVNRNYEFYGRRLVPVYVNGGADTAAASRALGADVAAQNVFAATMGYVEWITWPQASLPQELARRQIVTMMRGASFWWSDRVLYDSFHPYLWSVYPSAEDTQRNLGALVCRALAGHLAKNAAETPLQTQPRRFAIVAAGRQVPPSVAVLSEALTSCTDRAPSRLDWNSLTDTAAILQSGFNKLKSDGATTLICICESSWALTVFSAADTAGFHPEWIMTPTQQASGQDEHWMQTRRAGGQIAPVVRLSAGPRILPVQARPWFGALQSVNPTLVSDAASVNSNRSMAEFFYDGLLALAAGIQGAGPVLTPDTFAQALMSTQFANPGAGQPPYWQPSAGFGPGDHSLYDDYNVGWWSDSAEALDVGLSANPRGSWCYLQQAARFTPGTYPVDADQLLFNPNVPCR